MIAWFDTDDPPPREVALPLARTYVARMAWRPRWLRRRVEAAGGPPWEPQPSALDALARFVADRVGGDGPVTADPIWFHPPGRRPDWTEAGAELVEGLAATIAHGLVAATGARWVLDTDLRYATGHQPVLQGLVNTPQRMATLAVLEAREDRVRRPLSLLVPRIAGQYDPALRLGTAPDVAEPVTVAVTPLAHGPWDAQVSLPEDVRDRLDPEAYAGLEERFAAVPGVRRVVFEDHDVALVATEGVPADVLRHALDGVLADLTGAAAGTGDPDPAPPLG